MRQDPATRPTAAVAAERIDALLQNGDRAGAIELYRRFEARNPDAAHGDERVRASYERALWSVPQPSHGNIPAARRRLVGRGAEVLAVCEALASHRAVTLLGPAGIGKTRLALEIAGRVRQRYPGGVWWCDLTSATSAADLYAAISRTLALDPPIAEAAELVQRVGATALLLIFDRCELLAQTIAAFWSAIVCASETISVLCTSQCDLRAFKTIPVGSLSVPPSTRAGRAAALASDAVRLFVERATEVRPYFSLTDENAASVAEICRLADGSPFAIEIAAAYLLHAPVDELAKRIRNHSFAEIAKAARSSVEWAYRLLSPADAALLRSLSIFPRYWTIDDANAAYGEDAHAGLLRLLAASLVNVDWQEGGLTRYRLLDSTKEYAHERLIERGEQDEVLDRFMRSMRGFSCEIAVAPAAESIALALRLAQQSTRWLDGGLAICGDLGADLAKFPFVGDIYGLVRGLIEFARRQGRSTPEYRRALSAYAWLENYSGNHRRALELHEELIAYARASGERAELARALGRALPPMVNSRRLGEALRIAQEALEHARAAGDVAACADALRGMSAVHYFEGRYDEALRAYEEFAALDQEAIPKATIALMLNGFSAIMKQQGNFARARAALEHSLTLAYDIGDYGLAAHSEKNLSFYLQRAGEIGKAHEALRRAIGLAQIGANALTRLDALEDLTALSIGDGQLETLAFTLGFIDAGRRRSRFELELQRAERSRRLRAVVRMSLGAGPYETLRAAGEQASLQDVFERVSRLRPGTPLEEADRFAVLSPREREVAQLVARGRTNREIAAQLALSVRTVDAHVASIMRKVGVSRREQIAGGL